MRWLFKKSSVCFIVQIKELAGHVDVNRFVSVTAVSFQIYRWIMKYFIDHGLGHSLKGDAIVFRKMFEGLQGFLNFAFGNMLHFGSQRHDGGYNIQAFIPLAELNDGLIHDAFPFDSLPIPVLDVFVNDIFQVVDIINISIAQAVDFGIDVGGTAISMKKTGRFLRTRMTDFT